MATVATWQHLIGNLAIVALFISTWVHGQFLLDPLSRAHKQAVLGLVFGVGAMVSILLSTEVVPGVLFDLRLSLIAMAAFFGGPVGGVLALVCAAVTRLLVGGAGAWAGVLAMTLTAAAALIVSRATRRRMPAGWSAAALAGVTALVAPLVGAVFTPEVFLTGLGVVHAAMNFAGTLICTFFIMRQRSLERDRDVIKAALLQSPDQRYVKLPDSSFIAANMAVAEYYGLSSPLQLTGKTDYDLTTPERAAALIAEEQRIVATGIGYSDREEELPDAEGRPVWWLTTKVPLRDQDGEIIGIAGVTRDITQRKLLEQEVIERRDQLNLVLSEMSDGVAQYDRNGVLLYCNQQYRNMFPLTSDVRNPGTHLRDILRTVVARGEQVLPDIDPETWIEQLVATIGEAGEEEVQLHNGRWLTIRRRPTAHGSSLVVSDITHFKESETALKKLTEQLERLAATDSLTGLMNRRAFDVALESEVARARRDGTPLSLLMIDVDRFKEYNDVYGHQAGDEILRRVATCLDDNTRRPADIAARYGGEEFAAVLPDTDEDGAYFIAEAFRQRLAMLALPHERGVKASVSASVGLATFTAADGGLPASELVRRADEALYNAKGAGRDRVMGWRARYGVRPVDAASA